MDAQRLTALAIACVALVSLLMGAALWRRHAAARRSARVLTAALARRAEQAQAAAQRMQPAHVPNALQADDSAAWERTPGTPGTPGISKGWQRLIARASEAGMRWLDTPLGRQIVADEDRRVLDQCGFVDARARGLFLIARIGGALVLPLIALASMGFHPQGPRGPAVVVIALLVGFMLAKIVVQRRAAARRQAVTDELPMLVDLLRLLQGVGLSLDQSLQVMVNDFRNVLPVLSGELAIARRATATRICARSCGC